MSDIEEWHWLPSDRPASMQWIPRITWRRIPERSTGDESRLDYHIFKQCRSLL